MYDAQVGKWITPRRDPKVKDREGLGNEKGPALLDVSRSCRFYCTLIGISRISSKPSAAGWGSSIGTTSDTDTKCRRPSEDPDALPPLEELFGELQGDDYIDRLEELAESLLREVTAEVEANTTRPNEQVIILIKSWISWKYYYVFDYVILNWLLVLLNDCKDTLQSI